MENILKSTLLLLCGITLFTACDDDMSHNPTIQKVQSFTLNTPAYSNSTIDLATSNTLDFTWSQPDYGFPALANYQVQISPTDSWTKDIQAGELDANNKTVGDYKTLDQDYAVVKASILAADIAKGLEQITHYAEDAVPDIQKVYVRIRAMYAGDTIYSNKVTVNVAPYYVELKDAAPLEWYLVGSCIGDGTWNNSSEKDVYKSLIPLYMIDGQEYDKKTGTGKISYTDYFPEGGKFKVILTPGKWNPQIAYSNFNGIKADSNYETDDDGNVVVKNAGYYTVTVDTKAGTATIEKYTKSVNKYANIFLAGQYNSWNTTEDAMSPVSSYTGAENHNWIKTVTFSEAGTFKFTDATTWWGGAAFPYGTANTSAGDNKYAAGTYKAYFNDITGQYYFIETE